MEIKCMDTVFGEMKYKYRWYKMDILNMFGKDWTITVAAKAYSGKPITNEQRESYKWFKNNYDYICKRFTDSLKCYINQNCEQMAMTWIGARMINYDTELCQIVVPKTLLFKQDGSIIILFDCVWDPEHGLGIQILPELVIGSQDTFL